MSYRIRAARMGDLDHLYEMAKLTGGGFTNLPPDREALTRKLERGAEGFARDADTIGDDLFVFALENVETGQVVGTCQIFSQVGQKWPFYSYRISTHTQHSAELERTFRAEILNLTTDLEGSSEVGGLFLHPGQRAGGNGLLLARSRYLFIAMHRQRFADTTLAELRGVIDEAGNSPFWDGVAGRFFGMPFYVADEFNATHGNQFIADLMPHHPVYIAMLPDTAKTVIGVPHPSGRAAMRMLENEGFHWEKYIDIFDGGPTMTSRTDQIRSVRMAKRSPVIGIAEDVDDEDGFERVLAAHGTLDNFCAVIASVEHHDDGIVIDAHSAEVLGVSKGGIVTHVPRF